jgi:hypothetical protein
MKITQIILSLSALLFLPVSAWWCQSHMLIAQIAKDNLEPKVLEKVNREIEWFSKNNDFPMANDIVDVACWADDLKNKENLYAMEEWHFINLPYNPENISLQPMEAQNVVFEINELSRSIHENYQKYNENKWIFTFAIANLIHFYGDISQPLHATELFSKKQNFFPFGDRGGLLFDIFIENYPMKLHFAWDSVCRKYLDAPNRPLNDTSREEIENIALYLQQTYNFTEQEKKEYNMTRVALESYDYAVEYAYLNNTLKVNQTLNSDYINNCIYIAEKRITLAGYRLASQLNFLLK